MKTRNLTILALSFALAACGSPKNKVEELAAGLNAGGNRAPQKSASGPNLEGKWISGCIKNPLVFNGEGKRIITIEAKGDQMEHNVTTYADATCRRPNREQDAHATHKGSWKFVRTGVVEIRQPIDSNISALDYFTAAIEGETLKIGELGGLDSAKESMPSIELKKTAAEIPQGKITLQSGLYKAAAGERGDDVAISSMNIDGAVKQVWVDFPGSNTAQAVLKCEADLCKGSNGQFEYVMKIRNAFSFELSVPAFGVTVTYAKN